MTYKRSFYAGKWNGFGGKLQPGESPLEAAQRELDEEAGIRMINPKDLGIIVYKYEDMEKELKVHLFVAEAHSGEPRESEEMRPRWFSPEEIPYAEMWADDVHWYRFLLQRQPISARFHFEKDMKTIRTFDVRPLQPQD